MKAVISETPAALNVQNPMTFATVYDQYIGLLLYVAGQFRVSREEREDLVQETFVRLLEATGVFTMNSVKSFLVVTLRHLMIDRARRSSFRRTESAGDDIASYETQLWTSDDSHERAVNAVAQAIADIAAEPNNAAFAMFYRDGLSAKEISARSGQAIGSVTAKICRLRARHQTAIREKVELAMQS